MVELYINVCGTITGGLLLTLILFLLNEYAFPKRNLSGEWTATVKIENTSYKPFEGLTIEYKIHLLQKGYELSGSGEKIKDIKPDGQETVFLREKRVLIDVDGYYERKFLKKSKVHLNINEEGRRRETRATYSLTIKNKSHLAGKFISTAADSSGVVTIIKS